MRIEPRACPYCKSEKIEEDWGDDGLRHRCCDCDAKGPETEYEDFQIEGETNEKAVLLANIMAWNGA